MTEERNKPTTKHELEKLLTEFKDSAQVEVLELARGTFSSDNFIIDGNWEDQRRPTGWSHVASVSIRIGPLDFTATILCHGEGRHWRCLWCSDTYLVQLLDTDAWPDHWAGIMGTMFHGIVFPTLHRAIMQWEQQGAYKSGTGKISRQTNGETSTTLPVIPTRTYDELYGPLHRPTTMYELEKLLEDCKDRAQVEIFEVAHAEFDPDIGVDRDGTHVARLSIRIGPLDFTAKILCSDLGYYWSCLWCSDPDLVQLLKSDPKADGDPDLGPDRWKYTMGAVFRHLPYSKLVRAVRQFEQQLDERNREVRGRYISKAVH